MKKTLLALGLATGLAVSLFAGETLHLNLVPDRDVLLKGRPQEVVVKIDLSAIADRQKHERRRPGGGKWLRHRHRPGFLTPAGLLREVREPGNGNPPLLHDGAAGGGHSKRSAQNQCLASWTWLSDRGARTGITQKRANN